MSYKLEWKQSPNYTPGNQTQAFYGQPRSIKFGAGHWWGSPTAGYSHDGVVNTFMNPSRQASAHAVVSAGRVTEMVRAKDTSWATGNANPFTYSIELKPNMTAADKETCAEYIADKGYHNLTWYPHKHWMNTECNPLPWGEIMARAKQIYDSKHTAEWVKNLTDIKDVKLTVLPAAGTKVYNLNTLAPLTSIPKGTVVDIAKKTTVKGKSYLISSYSVTHAMPNGIPAADLGVPAEPPKDKPEWLKNWQDIADEVMYTRIEAPLVDLTDGKTLKVIPINTPVEIASATVWHGQNYLITKYSTDKKLAQGIALVNLDKDPIKQPDDPIPPAPQQPPLEERVGNLEKLVKLIISFLEKVFKGFTKE